MTLPPREFIVFHYPVSAYPGNMNTANDSRPRVVGAARRPTAVDAAIAVWQHGRCRLPQTELRAAPREEVGESIWREAVAANDRLPGALNEDEAA